MLLEYPTVIWLDTSVTFKKPESQNRTGFDAFFDMIDQGRISPFQTPHDMEINHHSIAYATNPRQQVFTNKSIKWNIIKWNIIQFTIILFLILSVLVETKTSGITIWHQYPAYPIIFFIGEVFFLSFFSFDSNSFLRLVKDFT